MRDVLKVGECMTVGVITLPGNKTAFDAAKLLKKTQVGSIIVTKDKKADGIVTERDIIYKVVSAGLDPKKTLLKKIMTCPLKVIDTEKSIEDAALAMKRYKIKRLPVIDKKKRLVGIITEGDLLRVYPGMTTILVEKARMGEIEPQERIRKWVSKDIYSDYEYKEERDV
ncbi:MAG: CBS domain-containing protein [Candidatus Anstonellales archaeon]